MSVTAPNDDARVFRYYDVSYVSVGDKQTEIRRADGFARRWGSFYSRR